MAETKIGTKNQTAEGTVVWDGTKWVKEGGGDKSTSQLKSDLGFKAGSAKPAAPRPDVSNVPDEKVGLAELMRRRKAKAEAQAEAVEKPKPR